VVYGGEGYRYTVTNQEMGFRQNGENSERLLYYRAPLHLRVNGGLNEVMYAHLPISTHMALTLIPLGPLLCGSQYEMVLKDAMLPALTQALS
jgi:hypothetical protein